MDNFYFPGWKA